MASTSRLAGIIWVDWVAVWFTRWQRTTLGWQRHDSRSIAVCGPPFYKGHDSQLSFCKPRLQNLTDSFYHHITADCRTIARKMIKGFPKIVSEAEKRQKRRKKDLSAPERAAERASCAI